MPMPWLITLLVTPCRAATPTSLMEVVRPLNRLRPSGPTPAPTPPPMAAIATAPQLISVAIPGDVDRRKRMVPAKIDSVDLRPMRRQQERLDSNACLFDVKHA